jgi:hypothetical protein
VGVRSNLLCVLCPSLCVGLDLSVPGQRQVARFCDQDNEGSVSLKCREFLDWLRDC